MTRYEPRWPEPGPMLLTTTLYFLKNNSGQERKKTQWCELHHQAFNLLKFNYMCSIKKRKLEITIQIVQAILPVLLIIHPEGQKMVN